IEMTGNASDDRLKPAYYMLGETYLQLGDDKKAADALKNAVDNPANKEQFIKVTLKLVEAEIRQENFVTALNTLENIPAEQLAQEHATEVLIKKATVLRLLDIPDTAISMLRHKIEFIADATQRAKLSFELARCYMQVGDIRVAREELSDVISDMPPGPKALQAQLLLAEATMELQEYAQVRITCLNLLNSGVNDPAMRQQALSLLGKSYTELDQHDKAALAYAGIFDKAGSERN
ncbi:MAG: tetratricopeptide repeat protein, partial [Planctomycetes bacterium]|nr:tetratricopeptide repeat protein [Planctomycetota bacterium]